jgi:hypothetical protein
MVKPAKPRAKGTLARSAEPGRIARVPDVAVLARYSPEDPKNAHPDWIKASFADYISPHDAHHSTSVREFTHSGHVVKITTTYKIEVDGHEINPHLFVDEDGRVFTHATPFVTYGSAIDLVSAMIDAYPTAFHDLAEGGAGSSHAEAHKPRRRKPK